MLKKEAFQEKIRQLGALVGELDAMPENGGKGAARELVQLLLEVHGSGLERIMEIIDESGEPGDSSRAHACTRWGLAGRGSQPDARTRTDSDPFAVPFFCSA